LPVLIPPSWGKSPETAFLCQVWTKAAEKLKQAWQIVIIGYSLPVTDVFFKHLLGVAIKDNNHLSAVSIVNPSKEVEERFSALFTRPMHEHGRITFLKWTLEDFVMRQKLRSLPYPLQRWQYDL
jgi:hypothetical protein